MRFPGQYFDAETGLHYNWHRYYDPTTGRYITADPIGIFPLGEMISIISNPIFLKINHLYNYTNQNPINEIDPKGLISISYGNYCGPGTNLTKMKSPVDAVDAACMIHDLCYQNNVSGGVKMP